MDLPQLARIMSRFPLFANLRDQDWAPLLDGHKFRNFPHHATLFSSGEPAERFAIVLTGAFKLVRIAPRGEDSIVYFASPGDVIGGLVMLKPGGTFPISAIALGASTVLELPRATYLRAWANSAVIQARLNGALYSRMSVLQEEKANSKLSLQQRVASLLLTLLDRKGATPDSNRLPIPLTRQEIADAVGSSVESVIRCMSEMSQQGLIQTEGKHIEILRVDKVAEILKT